MKKLKTKEGMSMDEVEKVARSVEREWRTATREATRQGKESGKYAPRGQKRKVK